MADLEVITVPNIEYSGFYFPEIAARLRRFNRVYAPEITDENLRSIFIQLERAFSLVAHYNNVLADMVANEVFLETAKLPESVRLSLNLINYNMLSNSPGKVDMLATLSKKYSTTTRILEANRRFATSRTPDDLEIVFENLDVVDTTNRTDRISEAYGVVKTKSGVCSSSSLYPTIITRTSGDTFASSDINNYIQISDSSLGNNSEDLRITELLDEYSPGLYNQVRLENGSFISETSLTWEMRSVTENFATDLSTGVASTIFPSIPVDNDKFYFGHSDILFDRYDLVFSNFALGVDAVIEFYDDSETPFTANSVTVDPSGNSGHIRFDLTAILGTEERTGALIRVKHLISGNESNAFSTFESGSNVVDISGYLGQTTPSTVVTDYLIFLKWREIDVVEDETKSVSVPWCANGKTTYNIPQNQIDNWKKYTLYDSDASEIKTAYMLRYRVINNAGAAIGPIPSSLTFTSAGHYILTTLTQGKTVEDSPLGSSDGTSNQEFTLANSPYVENSIVLYVDEGGGDVEWSQVETLWTTFSYSRNYTVTVKPDNTTVIKFGDGTYGKIPPLGTNNIRCIYRIGADEDGNIGVNKLTVNRDGAGVFKAITNPRGGYFWYEADWASQSSLERVKELGPLNLRTMRRAVDSKDCEVLAKLYKNSEGVRPIARAKAYEESFGPKTVELVVVGQGGISIDSTYSEELEEFFNGTSDVGGVLMTNHELTVTNYIPRLIGFTIEVTCNYNVTEALILQSLSSIISPTAYQEDKVTHLWKFGQEIPLSRIISELFNISPGNIFKVNITSPSSDISLGSRELPVFDITSTQIVILPYEV